MSYQLEPAQLPFCQGFWDPKKKEFTDNDSMDVIMCCINSCKDYIGNCYRSCHGTYGPDGKLANYKNHEKCHNQCEQMTKNCENVCLSYPSPGMKEITQCAHDHECGTFPLLDSACMNDNKQFIIDCCRKTCQLGDCDRECKQFWEHLVHGTNAPLTDLKNRYNISKVEYKKRDDKKYLYVIYFILAVLIFLAVYILKN